MKYTIQQLEAIETCNQAMRYLIRAHSYTQVVAEALDLLTRGRDIARGIESGFEGVC